MRLVDRVQRIERVIRKAQPGVARAGAHIVELRIEAVVADLGGANRPLPHRLIEPSVRQRRERAIRCALALTQSFARHDRHEHG